MSGAGCSGLRLTDLLARLHVVTGRLPAAGACAQAGHSAAAGSVLRPGLGAASRASILDPLGRDRPVTDRPARVFLPFLSEDEGPPPRRAAARQVDETTCGAAVLAMLAMAGDPRLALRVAGDPARRFAALQQRVHRACARSGSVPWPRRLGTAPWDAAAVARYGSTRYTHRVIGGDSGRRVLVAALAAAEAGVPVPRYTGGDLGGGWRATVPRHVVLLVDARPDAVRIYEPSSATVHTVPVTVLLDPESATARERAALTAALGRWPHLVWALLPC